MYADTTQVVSIWPTTGPVRGGTIVTVFGSFMLRTVGLYCKFGTKPSVEATFFTTSQIECLSPSVEFNITVPVEVSINNVHFSSDGVAFEYQRMRLVLFMCRC